MTAAARIYGDRVTSVPDEPGEASDPEGLADGRGDVAGGGPRDRAPPIDDVELIGDEELGDGETAAVENSRSCLDATARRALRERLGDGIRFDEPMRRHTTVKI